MSASVTPPTDRRLANFRGGSVCIVHALLSLLLLAATAGVGADTSQPNPDFDSGLRSYNAGQFKAAAAAFEKASLLEPDNDDIAYWLAKACGRMAERAGPLTAIKWAGCTRDALERAVALNPDNTDAVDALADYYDQAPGFLGGDPAKARELRARLAAASTATGDASSTP